MEYSPTFLAFFAIKLVNFHSSFAHELDQFIHWMGGKGRGIFVYIFVNISQMSENILLRGELDLFGIILLDSR